MSDIHLVHNLEVATELFILEVLATANPVVYGIFSNVLGNALHSHIHSSHLDKSEVQLLERHFRLTVCAWYTQCMMHSQDKLVCVPPPNEEAA